MRSLEDRTLLLLVIAVTLAFAWILWPFFSAVLWATVLAIVFAPLYRRILRSIGQHPNLAALATLLIVVTLVILPLSLTATSLVDSTARSWDRAVQQAATNAVVLGRPSFYSEIIKAGRPLQRHKTDRRVSVSD